MEREVVAYTDSERLKLRNKLAACIAIVIGLVLIPFIYAINVDAESREAEGMIFCFLFPLLFGIATLIRTRKLLSFLKRNTKFTVTGIVTKKDAHYRAGRNSTSWFYIEIDKGENFQLKNETLFDSIRTGLHVRLNFLEDESEFTSFDVLSSNEETKSVSDAQVNAPSGVNIEVGYTSAEIEIVKEMRWKNFKRKLIYVVFFGLVEIPGLLLIVGNPIVLHLIVVGVILTPYIIFIISITYKYNKDLRKQQKKCFYSVVIDKFVSDRVITPKDVEEFSMEKPHYLNCRHGLYNVSKSIYDKCNLDTIVYVETAMSSGVLLNISIKKNKTNIHKN